MKNYIIILIASLGFASCQGVSGNGNVRDEKRNVSNFHAIETSGSIDVEINSGDSYSLSVSDDGNLLPYVVTEVNDGVLDIHYKNGISINNDHIKVSITAPSLDKIITSGSGNITGDGIIKNTNQIEFNLSGSGDIDANVDAPNIKVTGSGSGNIKLTGKTKDFDCRMSGSGEINCSRLEAENTTVSMSGSGDAHVFASVHLLANTSGIGDIYYLGNPTTEIHTSGTGSVEQDKKNN